MHPVNRGGWHRVDPTRVSRRIEYGSEHLKWRAAVLRKHPLCVHCLVRGQVSESTVADHIVPIEAGGARYDLDNAQGLCRSCHARKSQSERLR